MRKQQLIACVFRLTGETVIERPVVVSLAAPPEYPKQRKIKLFSNRNPLETTEIEKKKPKTDL